MLGRLRSLTRSETSRAAELGIAAMGANVVALVFTLVFTRVLGQNDYGSLAALISTFLILNVPGYALQTTVAREVGAAVAAGEPHPGAAVGRWLRRLVVEQTARLLFGVVLAVAGLDVTGAFLGTPLALALVAIALWRPLHRHVGDPGRVREEPGHRLRDLVRRAWAPILALGLIAWLQDGHIIVVKHLASDHDAGAWAALAVAGKAIMFVAIGLAGYVVPEVARSAS